MKKLFLPVVLGVLFLAIPGRARADYYFYVNMDGTSETPPNDEVGVGAAVVIINDNLEKIEVHLTFEG